MSSNEAECTSLSVGDDPHIRLEMNDSAVVITFKFEGDFPIDEAHFVGAVGTLILRELS